MQELIYYLTGYSVIMHQVLHSEAILGEDWERVAEY